MSLPKSSTSSIRRNRSPNSCDNLLALPGGRPDGGLVRDFEVQFGSGQEVLNAYWGYLSDGGLVIEDAEALAVGDPVALAIEIASSGAAYNLRGKVVKRQADSGYAVIAFDPGQPHDLLLSEALAETDNVPARRHRRYWVDLSAKVSRNGSDPRLEGRLVNISREGCCVHLGETDRGSLSVGSPIAIEAGNFQVGGEVMWQRNLERGIRFDIGEAASLKLLHEYLRTLG